MRNICDLDHIVYIHVMMIAIKTSAICIFKQKSPNTTTKSKLRKNGG